MVTSMLRNWSGECIKLERLHELYFEVLKPLSFIGLMYFCMDNMRAIRALIDTLRIPSLESRVRLTSIYSPAPVHTDVKVLNDTRREGSCPGYVLRSLEYQDAGMVSNIHQREAVNK